MGKINLTPAKLAELKQKAAGCDPKYWIMDQHGDIVAVDFDSKCPDCPNLKSVRSIEEYLIQVTPDVVISLCNRLVWLENMFRRQAVPELYQALEKAVENYGKPGGPWNCPEEPGTWLAMAQAALQKARGEEA